MKKVVFPKGMRWAESPNSGYGLYSSEGALIAFSGNACGVGWYLKPFDNTAYLPYGPVEDKMRAIETILADNNYYGVKWNI